MSDRQSLLGSHQQSWWFNEINSGESIYAVAQNSMESNIIQVKNVKKSFGSLKAVDDISFDVPKYSCFGFLGPNGAGKTTLIKILYGKSYPDQNPAGEVTVFGLDPQKESLNVRSLSSVVPQEDNLDGDLNVAENLVVYAKFYGIPHRLAKVRIKELLQFMELSEKQKSRVIELSGGLKRRLSIARALLHHPRLLILDEPTTGLDPQVRHMIWAKLRQLKAEGTTILLSTHYMEEAFQICDRILIMDKGKKMMEGVPKNLLAEHVEQFVIETVKFDKKQIATLPFDRNRIRSDYSHQMPVYYSNDLNALKELENYLIPGNYQLRHSNLEDLFLKTTGRNLNEQQ